MGDFENIFENVKDPIRETMAGKSEPLKETKVKKPDVQPVIDEQSPKVNA